MLKSFIREIIGAPPVATDPCPSLLAFRNTSHVLVLFEGGDDDRPEAQEQLLENQQDVLSAHNIAIVRVAGGGVFTSLDQVMEIEADEVRHDLDGPSPEEFEAVLIDPQGETKLRSREPVSVPFLTEAIGRLPTER
ncbi:hypothetical protein FHT77_006047 [Rhizobium sp. BK181]|uniref:DUF4174 domain-containing protein n=1 Tax=Rhizobium sp. BK181 TaxID=2587072 RepID=UPI0016154602|nr:DUF4174 domain-containing protein [Rhizobium sp. BK181]MBB3320128.1 hypothetical protein [Rhizobium sp. BK181]